MYSVVVVSTNYHDPSDMIVKVLTTKERYNDASAWLADYLLLDRNDEVLENLVTGGYIQNDGDGNGHDDYDTRYFITENK